MAMAYASIKWKALANATPIAAGGAPADAVPPSEPRLRRARSLESSTLKDIRFKSAPVSTKKLLRAYDSETADDVRLISVLESVCDCVSLLFLCIDIIVDS